MTSKELSIAQKKEWAQLLFVKHDYTQKEIAQKVGVSEKTLSKWVNDSGWSQIKRSLLTTKEEQLSMLYNQLEALNRNIKETEAARHANPKQADILIKITAAIRNLQTETSVGQVIEVAQQFIRWLQRDDLARAQDITVLFDAFIKEQLKRA